MKKTLLILALLACAVRARATVTTTDLTVSFTCTGSTGPFPFTFPISAPAALTVTQNGTVLNSSVYTMTPVNNNYENGGSVTLNSSCPASQPLVLTRISPVNQTTVFADNMPIPMKTFEYSLDKLTEIEQEQSDSLHGLWGLPIYEPTAPSGNCSPPNQVEYVTSTTPYAQYTCVPGTPPALPKWTQTGGGGGGGSGNPGGTNGQKQYNDSGSFGGASLDNYIKNSLSGSVDGLCQGMVVADCANYFTNIMPAITGPSYAGETGTSNNVIVANWNADGGQGPVYWGYQDVITYADSQGTQAVPAPVLHDCGFCDTTDFIIKVLSDDGWSVTSSFLNVQDTNYDGHIATTLQDVTGGLSSSFVPTEHLQAGQTEDATIAYWPTSAGVYSAPYAAKMVLYPDPAISGSNASNFGLWLGYQINGSSPPSGLTCWTNGGFANGTYCKTAFSVDPVGNGFFNGNLNIGAGKTYKINGTQITTGNLGDWTNASVANGNVPVWNSSTSKWTPGSISAGGVTSVSNSDGSLVISPTTGAVVASWNPAHSNTITANQTFSGSSANFTVPSPSNPSIIISNTGMVASDGVGQDTTTYGRSIGLSGASVPPAEILFTRTGSGSFAVGLDALSTGIEVNNGTQGNALGNLQAATITAGTLFSGPGTGLTGTAAGLSIGGTAALATNISGGATDDLLYQTAASTTGFITPVNNAVVVTSAGGVPSESTTLPSGLTIPGFAPALVACSDESSTFTPVNSTCYFVTASVSTATPAASAFVIFTITTSSAGTMALTGTTIADGGGCSSYISGTTLTLTSSQTISVKSDGTTIRASCTAAPGSGTVTDGVGSSTANQLAVATSTPHVQAYVTTLPAAAIPSAIPIGDVGSAGLSGSGGVSIASTGAISLGGIPLTALATQATNTVVMNATGGTASPTAVAMPTCTSGADLYNTTTSAWSCVSTGGGTPAYPLTITGGVSGGVVYGSLSTQLTVSPAGTANVLMKWGGAATAPGNSSVTDNGTTVTTTDTGGYVGPVFTANGTTAGFADYPQGTTSAAVAPCNVANSICLQAPTSVTSQLRVFAGAPATGLPLYTNSSGTMTETILPLTGNGPNVQSALIAGAPTYTAGASVTSCVQATGYTNSNERGEVTIVGGTATTGTICTVNFSTTLANAPGMCQVTQNGGTTVFSIGHGTPGTASFTITSGISVVSSTLNVDYDCTP